VNGKVKRWKYAVVLAGMVILTGCAETGNTVPESDEIPETFYEQMVETESKTETKPEEKSEESTTAVDYDLTIMGSDMVYATVYQMMTDPDTYVGKVFRIRGNYNTAWYEPTGQYYQYVVISDATACCAQGLEFVWEDGSHIYPDEYPQQNAEIEVTGIYEIYQEEGDNNLYCRLNNASLKILQ